MEVNKKIIPWIIASVFFIEILDQTIISTAIPRMSLSLNVSPLLLKAAIISYLISLAVVIPISGWLSERFGSQKIMLISVLIFMAGSIFCALSSNLEELVLARVFQGIGGALMVPIGRMVMLHVFEKHEIIHAMNYVIIPGLIGSLTGPVLGGIIVTYFAWQWIFLINIPICLIGLLYIKKYIPNFLGEEHKRFDWIGFVLLAYGLGGSSYAMEGYGQHFMTALQAALLFLSSVISILICISYTKKKTHAVVDFSLFKIQSFNISFIASFFTRVSYTCIVFLMPMLYQIKFGWLPLYSGLLMVPFVIGSMVSKYFSHWVLAKVGVKRTLVIDSALLSLSIMAYALINQQTPVIFIILLSFIAGNFLSIFFSSCNAVAYSDLDGDNKVRGISIYSTVQRVSASYGVGLTAFCIEYFLGSTLITKNSPISAFHLTFICIGAIGLLSPILFMTLSKNVGASLFRQHS